MKISDMMPSKYLKQSDIPEPALVTMQGIKNVDVSPNGKGEMRWIMTFQELDKPMVLNSTNIKRVAKAHGDDSDFWTGKQMVIYVDEDVEYAGEIVGGLRLRAPKQKAQPKPEPEFQDDETLPF